VPAGLQRVGAFLEWELAYDRGGFDVGVILQEVIKFFPRRRIFSCSEGRTGVFVLGKWK
jgi:hypothetical protein